MPRTVLDRIRPVLNGRGQTALIAGAALTAAIILTAILWSSGSSFTVLYAGLSAEEGGRTIAELQKLNIPFTIGEGGRVIATAPARVTGSFRSGHTEIGVDQARSNASVSAARVAR